MTHTNYYDQDSSFITASKEYPVIAYYSKWANDWPDVFADAIEAEMPFDEYVLWMLHLERIDVQNGTLEIEETELLKRTTYSG
jgi:hypothetical protein